MDKTGIANQGEKGVIESSKYLAERLIVGQGNVYDDGWSRWSASVVV